MTRLERRSTSSLSERGDFVTIELSRHPQRAAIQLARAAAAMEQPPARARFEVNIPPEMVEAMTMGGVIASRISRAEALQVPAVLRGRNLIAGTIGSLPVVTISPEKRIVPTTYLLGGNINPEVPNTVTMSNTIEDMIFEGVAWWRVIRFGWHDYPVEARWVPATSVAELPPTDPDGHGEVHMNGRFVPDREVIRFDSPNPPLLRHAARAIRTALRLDRAAALYAEKPLPMSVFTPKDGVDPGEDVDMEAMLDEWEEQRERRGTGYVNAALDYQPVGWSPEQLQLHDARQHAVLEIARAFGVDPEDLGVSTTSRTYQNSEQRRLDLLDFTLGTYVSAVQDRLSMRDILPRNYRAKIKFEGFLRSDAKERMETYAIGKKVGAYTDDEIRDLEDKPRLTPAEKRAIAAPPTTLPPDATVTDVRVTPRRNGDRSNMHSDMGTAAFDGDDTIAMLSFDDPDVAATFRVNEQKRTISGLIVPWGKIAMSGGVRWRFAEGSLRWGDASRIKLNMGHDRHQSVGFAAALRNTTRGVDATFKVTRAPEGDRALTLAADKAWDGLSIEIDFEDDFGDDWQPDPADEFTRLVRQAKLQHVALTPAPAFDDARVAAVAASKQQQGRSTPGAEHRQHADRPASVVRVRTRF
jgi:phage head maturation protease